MRPDTSENSQISPSTIVRAARAAGSHPHLASVLLQGRKSANIHPVRESSEESPIKRHKLAVKLLRHNVAKPAHARRNDTRSSIAIASAIGVAARASRRDRKSTRLNSSHLGISYAV